VVDRPLLLFHWRRAIALLASKGRSLFFVWKGRSPLTTFSRATGDRTFDIERSIALYYFFTGDRSFCIERSIALYCFFTGDGRSILPLVPPFLRGVRGDQALTITLNQTQQLPTNPLKTLQHINISKPNNFQSIPL